MSRSLAVANASTVAGSALSSVIFAKLEFSSATIYVHTRIGNITWGGNTYLGVGGFGDISQVDEDSELSRNTLELTLSGVDSANIAIALTEYYQGRAATLYLGFLDLTTDQLVADPDIIYQGKMDVMDIEAGQEGTIKLSIESRLSAWDKPNVRRYNDADQQSAYAGDKFFEYAEQMVEKTIEW